MSFRIILLLSVLSSLCITSCSTENSSGIVANLDPEEWNYTSYGLLLDGNDLVEPLAQVETDRVYEERAVERIKTIGWYPEAEEAGNKNEILYSVAGVYIDTGEEYMYIFDNEDYAIKKYSLESGRLITVYGGVEGEGPGELKRPVGFTVTPDSHVLIADAKQHRVSVFDPDGNNIKDIQYPFSVDNIVAIANQKYVIPISATMEYTEVYGIFDFDGNPGSRFMNLSNDPRLNVGLAGILLKNGDNVLTHVIGYTGHIVGYSYDQELLFYRSSLDGDRGFPKWTKATISGTNREIARIDTTTIGPLYYRSINIWANELYVLRVDMEADKSDQVSIDVYATTNGDYLYSLNVPNENCGVNFVTNQHIYTNCENIGVVQWERPLNVSQNKAPESI